ncbi:adhesion G protein-coupled receptor L3 [Strongylocentrotus purpuratus]|uniref:Adhesion G-protein coupled receptor D1-like n=1 Tax=Strongylocentrotus purpuratus TaxID=7668 RepID=A0A7M7NM31_STRPU|nr:adhesion G protein-coupled receptor L3 [Strongylocentrotus purpuratus]
MAVNVIRFIAWLFFLATLTRAEDCDVESKNCTCVMPKLYDCPEVDLSLNPVPDGCPLLNEKLAGTDFSDLTCGGENDTFEPISGAISFTADGRWLEFENEACNDEFYFIVDLNGGQLVKTLKMEDMNPSVTTGQNVSFEVAYGYTVPCTDQPTLNTLLWQYITPGWYASDADITKVWNRLNFTNGAFGQVEATYFKASYLFVHFNHIPVNSRFRLSVTGCHETGKDIAPALEYLNSLLSVTNDTLEIVQGIAVSGTAIQSENNLTDDEVVLFLDAFASFEGNSLDLSNEPEEAQNLTDGFAEVASKVLSSITFVSIPLEHSGGVHSTAPSGLYTAGANEHTTSHNADKRVADQQARAILAIEQAIGVVTSRAGNATIIAKTENLIIESAPLRVTDTTEVQSITLSSGYGNEEEDATVQIGVDLSGIAELLSLPRSSNDNRSSVPVRFTAMQIKTDNFLETNQNTDFRLSATANSDKEEAISNKVFLNSDILSFTVYFDGVPQSVPIETSYTNKADLNPKENATYRRNESSTCVWLTENKRWSDTGCIATSQEDVSTTCSCGHTTSFAVLVQVVEFEISKADDLAMTILSYFGISLSILCLVIALFIFFTVGALRTSERNMIHRNLMIALLLAYVVFLGGIQYARVIPIMCTIVAALLHYLYLAVFGWMLIEGIHLYLMLVKVFGSEGSKQMYYLVIGWGAPVIVVAITVGIRHHEYGTEDMCWIKPGSGAIWAFVGPVIAVILFNFLVLCMVLRIIYRSSAINVDCPIDQVKAAAKGSIALLPILGLTWFLGIFALGKSTIFFQYLFVICNSTQGILLFVFHCLFNSEVRNALKREHEKMGWSTAGGTQSRKAKVHPEDIGTSTAKGLTTKGATKTTSAEEKSVSVYHSAQNLSGKGDMNPESKTKDEPKKTNSEFSLPGQIDDPLDEAQTSTIRQEIKTEREMEQGGWKINEKKHVQRTFVRVEDTQ